MASAKRRTSWSRSTEPEICHYKISFNLKTNLKEAVLQLVKQKSDVHTSFAVVRDIYVYIVYFGGFVNCCGILDHSNIRPAIRHFKELIGLADFEQSTTDYSVDNITGKGKFASDLRLTVIAAELPELIRESESKLFISYKPDHFGAIHFHFSKDEGGGLITLYHTGTSTNENITLSPTLTKLF